MEDLDSLFHWETVLNTVKDPFVAYRVFCTEKEQLELAHAFETEILVPFLKKKSTNNTDQDFVQLQKAYLGDAVAQFEVGQAWIKEGKENAIEWFKKAATQNHVESQMQLGAYYRRQSKQETALSWYRLAAQQGHVEAFYHVSEILYQKIQTTEAEKKEALNYAEEGTKAGNLDCMNSLCSWYYYLKINEEQSFQMRCYLAEQPNAKPEWYENLGFRYKTGHGTPVNNELAIVWYKKANDACKR